MIACALAHVRAHVHAVFCLCSFCKAVCTYALMPNTGKTLDSPARVVMLTLGAKCLSESGKIIRDTMITFLLH